MIGVEGLRSLDLRIGRHALPLEEEAQEVARGHGLDLGAQPLDRVVMDAGEQATLAPFVARRARREAAAHGEALGFQRRQSRRDLAGLQAERRGERVRRHRSQAFEPAAQDLDEGFIAIACVCRSPAVRRAAARS